MVNRAEIPHLTTDILVRRVQMLHREAAEEMTKAEAATVRARNGEETVSRYHGSWAQAALERAHMAQARVREAGVYMDEIIRRRRENLS